MDGIGFEINFVFVVYDSEYVNNGFGVDVM